MIDLILAIREAQDRFDANKSRQDSPIKPSFGGTGKVRVVDEKRECSSKIFILDGSTCPKPPTTAPLITHEEFKLEMKKSQST